MIQSVSPCRKAGVMASSKRSSNCRVATVPVASVFRILVLWNGFQLMPAYLVSMSCFFSGESSCSVSTASAAASLRLHLPKASNLPYSVSALQLQQFRLLNGSVQRQPLRFPKQVGSYWFGSTMFGVRFGFRASCDGHRHSTP